MCEGKGDRGEAVDKRKENAVKVSHRFHVSENCDTRLLNGTKARKERLKPANKRAESVIPRIIADKKGRGNSATP